MKDELLGGIEAAGVVPHPWLCVNVKAPYVTTRQSVAADVCAVIIIGAAVRTFGWARIFYQDRLRVGRRDSR